MTSTKVVKEALLTSAELSSSALFCLVPAPI